VPRDVGRIEVTGRAVSADVSGKMPDTAGKMPDTAGKMPALPGKIAAALCWHMFRLDND
jgi:hypothetical protein